MSLKSCIVCVKCKEVLNNKDTIVGSSCGHLYHFLCVREYYDQSSPYCPQCKAFKPQIYKMFLEFGETNLSWEDREKTIELHDNLIKKESTLCELERKYQFSQETVQKLELKLKKLSDTLISNGSAMDELTERLKTQELLNKFLQEENEIFALGNRTNDCNRPKERENNHILMDNSNRTKLLPAINSDKECEAKENDTSSSYGRIIKSLEIVKEIKVKETKNEQLNMQVPADAKNNKENVLNSKKITAAPIDANSELNENKSVSSSKQLSDSKTLTINNYRVCDLEKWGSKDTIVYLAMKMGVTLNRVEITNVIVIKNAFKRATLIVTFEKVGVADNLRSCKGRLRKFKHLHFLEIS